MDHYTIRELADIARPVRRRVRAVSLRVPTSNTWLRRSKVEPLIKR